MNGTAMERRRPDIRGPGPEIRGADEARENVFKFLSDTVGSVKVDMILCQLIQQGFQAGEPFYQFEFSKEDDLQTIADDIVQKAEEDIATCGSHKILYSVKLAQHNGRRNFALSINPEQGNVDGFGINESDMVPAARNMLSQQMQHNQVLFQASIGSFGEQLKMMAKTVVRQQERIQHLEAERERYIESREAIMSFQDERNLKMKQQEKSDFRMDQLASTAMNALAPIVNKYVKQKIIPEKATPIEGMMIALASTLTAEQIQNLINSGLFSPAQLSNFMQIFQTIHESFEEEKKKGAFVPPLAGQAPSGPSGAGSPPPAAEGEKG